MVTLKLGNEEAVNGRKARTPRAQEPLNLSEEESTVSKKEGAAAGKQPAKPEPKKIEARQEVLQFDAVSRGRFEKSEPTIVDGQDLDVPSFLRRRVKVG
jgi:cell division protein FtsZ